MEEYKQISALGANIRKFRQQSGLTIGELAARIDVSLGTVSRWERGDSTPTRAKVAAIAGVLSITTQDIETSFDMKQPTTPMIMQDDPRYRAAKTIAFQGRPGAYSHQAAQACFPKLQTIPCDSFADTFQTLSEGRADLAMIPIENSLGGRVADIHHLLPESNLFILGEFFLPISHALMVHENVGWDDLAMVTSHEQALAQCRRTLRALDGVVAEKSFDTAGAAEKLAQDKSATHGVLASELAAQVYGLKILRTKMEDRLGNVTRFCVMSRQRNDPDPHTSQCQTSFIFTLRSVPAALYKSMGGFATNGVNFVKLESYIPIADRGEIASFYAEIEGHPSQANVDQAMQELQYYTQNVKILGVYPKASYRDQR